MNGPFFYIGLGLGLALACGLRPFLPLLLAGVLGSAGALGVAFTHDPYRFLQSHWWLLTVTVALVLAYALQLTLGPSPTLDSTSISTSGSISTSTSTLGSKSTPGVARADPLAATLAGLGLGAGALLFAGTLAAHGDAWWPGLVGGLLAAALAQRASGPVIARARLRLPDRAAREALTVYLDAASLLLATLVSLLHPLGYVAIALIGWFLWRARARSDDKHAGLRILRR